MKKLSYLLLFFLPFAVNAQNPFTGMDQAQMQQMMQQAQEAQACMEDIDQSKVKRLEAEAKQFEAEIKQLCASGDRSAAQSKAVAFSRRVMDDPAIQEMRKCTDKMKGMMDAMSQNMPLTQYTKDYADSHVCDAY